MLLISTLRDFGSFWFVRIGLVWRMRHGILGWLLKHSHFQWRMLTSPFLVLWCPNIYNIDIQPIPILTNNQTHHKYKSKIRIGKKYHLCIITDWLTGIWLITGLYCKLGAYSPLFTFYAGTNPFFTCDIGIIPCCCIGPKFDINFVRIYWFWVWVWGWGWNVCWGGCCWSGGCCWIGAGMRWLLLYLLIIAVIFWPDDIGISCCCCCCWAMLALSRALNLILSS